MSGGIHPLHYFYLTFNVRFNFYPKSFTKSPGFQGTDISIYYNYSLSLSLSLSLCFSLSLFSSRFASLDPYPTHFVVSERTSLDESSRTSTSCRGSFGDLKMSLVRELAVISEQIRK